MGYQGVGGRVPSFFVDAIDDPAQAIFAFLQQAIHATAKFLALNFYGVIGTDGVDPVSVYQAALEEAELIPELQGVV